MFTLIYNVFGEKASVKPMFVRLDLSYDWLYQRCYGCLLKLYSSNTETKPYHFWYNQIKCKCCTQNDDYATVACCQPAPRVGTLSACTPFLELWFKIHKVTLHYLCGAHSFHRIKIGFFELKWSEKKKRGLKQTNDNLSSVDSTTIHFISNGLYFAFGNFTRFFRIKLSNNIFVSLHNMELGWRFVCGFFFERFSMFICVCLRRSRLHCRTGSTSVKIMIQLPRKLWESTVPPIVIEWRWCSRLYGRTILCH